MRFVPFVGVGLVAVVFLTAGLAKLRDPRALATALRIGTRPAFALGLAETGTGLLVVLPVTRRAGLIAATVLLVALTAGIAALLRSGRTASCACFGRTSAPLRRDHLLRNGLLLSITALAAVAPAHAAWPAALIAAGAGLVLGALAVAWDDVVHIVLPEGPPDGLPDRRDRRSDSARTRATAVHAGGDPAAA